MDGYDVVIVGGGTAGCVLAARLSENPDISTLLLEAGAAESPAGAEVPPAWPDLLASPANWGDIAFGPTSAAAAIPVARGRVLGGSSAINAMVHIRGHRSSYDRWPELGARGWGFDDLLPYLRRIETARGRDPALRGTDGPLLVGPATPPHPVPAACLDAAEELGYRRAGDISGGLEEGFGWVDLNIVDGRRQSAVDAYLRPAMARRNLHVVTGALAHRVLMDRTRCVGVEYSVGTTLSRAAASAEVVLTAGAIGTPALLMRSGIGPAPALRPHAVEVVAELPGVGENLQDHPYAFVIYRPARPLPPPMHNHGEALGRLRSAPDLDGPDLGILFVDIPLAPGPESGYTIAAALLRPFSRGTVRLAAADPRIAPRVDPRYLDDPRDVRALASGLAVARRIGQASALAPWRAEEVLPGPGVNTDAALRDYATATMQSYYHPVGTCRIGTDALSVVDTALRVHGIDRLRIADASVMPSIVSANTNATVYAIAERAARLIAGQSRIVIAQDRSDAAQPR
ncbi:GMC family oxidoreductase [Nocardia sp. NPDC051570]|uniref:GMC family oxidoreductase n=1 Tax=Nocardia sp. NPDC051570 TaxID=3364324 RepID=UPI00379A5E73